MGTAFAGVVAVGLLSSIITSTLVDNPKLLPEIKAQVRLDDINFVRNDQSRETLGTTTATPAQVEEAVRINTEARLRALKESFFILAALALLVIVPALGLPRYVPGEVPNNPSETAPPRLEGAPLTTVER